MSAPVVEFRDGKRSEAGPRSTNEDGALIVHMTDGSVLAAVADGMGGLDAGEVASHTALQALRRSVDAGLDLREAFMAANEAVRRAGGGREMGTTLVAAHLTGRELRIAHVGDSRAYLVDRAGCRLLTRDHTVQAEARAHGLDGESMNGSPWGRAVTRSLGTAEEVDVDVLPPLDVDEEDAGTLLLCTDGVHAVLDDDRIGELVAEGLEPESAAERLVAAALEGGSTDNATAVILAWRSEQDDHHDGPDWEAPARTAVGGPRWDPGHMVSVSRRPDPGQSNWRMIFLMGSLLLVIAVALLAVLA